MGVDFQLRNCLHFLFSMCINKLFRVNDIAVPVDDTALENCSKLFRTDDIAITIALLKHERLNMDEQSMILNQG